MMIMRTNAVVKSSYVPKLKNELGLTKGEYVYVVEKSTDGWWKGEADGKTGWFPSNYVEEVEASSNGNQGSIPNRNPIASIPPPAAVQLPPQQQQVSAPRASRKVVVAPYSFEAWGDDELSFSKGEKLEIVSNSADDLGWRQARNGQGVVGFVPKYIFKEERSNSIERLAFSLNNNCAVAPTMRKIPMRNVKTKAADVSSLEWMVGIALHSFDASSSEELSFKKCERLEIFSHPEHDPDWLQARNRQGTVGLVPRNYIEVIDPSSLSTQDFAPQYSNNPEIKLEDELGLTKGEHVYVVEKSTDGWWEGEADSNTGWFPSDHLEQQQISAPRASLKIAVALYSFDAFLSEELSFNKGEVLEIVSLPKHDRNWLQVRNGQGIVGLVPRNHIGVINPFFLSFQDFAPLYANNPEIEQAPWFFGSIASELTDKLLQKGKLGEWLIRYSEILADFFFISIKSIERNKHFKVHIVDGHLEFGKRKFMNIEALITHYTSNPIFSSPTEKLYLTGPLPK